MTVINPQKENWPSRGSNQRPLVLKSAMLPTELWFTAYSCSRSSNACCSSSSRGGGSSSCCCGKSRGSSSRSSSCSCSNGSRSNDNSSDGGSSSCCCGNCYMIIRNVFRLHGLYEESDNTLEELYVDKESRARGGTAKCSVQDRDNQ